MMFTQITVSKWKQLLYLIPTVESHCRDMYKSDIHLAFNLIHPLIPNIEL